MLSNKLKSLKDKIGEGTAEIVKAVKPKKAKVEKSKKKNKIKGMKKIHSFLIAGLVGLLMAGGVALAANVINNFYGNSVINQAETGDQSLGAFAGPEIYQDLNVHGYVASDVKTTAEAKTSTTSTITLALTDSGTTYLLSASGTTITLPAVTDGLNFRFIVNGAIDTQNYVIDSAEGDNIEGTLIVAGAVVDCAGEDQINILADGENVGDYVELISDGSQWLIGDSGVLTTGKMTCTDPS